MTRLQRFRGFLARMNPTKDPSAALRDNLYVTADGGSLADQLQTSLELDSTGAHLVLGGIGSGKTSEVLRAVAGLSKPLGELGDVVEYIDVSEHTRLELASQAGVLLALAGRRLSTKFTRAERVKSGVREALEILTKLAVGYDIWVPERPDEDEPEYDDDDEPDDDEPGEFQHIPGVLSAPERRILSSRLRSNMRALRTLRDARPGAERFVVLAFDALDRLPKPEQFVTLVREDMHALKQCGIGVIVVGPIRYIVGNDRSIGELFDQVHYKLAIDPSQPDGLEFLTRVLHHRAGDAKLLSDASIVPLALASGGVLRDLITLAKRAAEDAYTSGAEQIDEGHVAHARDAMGRGLAVGLDDDQLKALRKVHDSGGFVVRGARELSLLETRRVLMYEGSRWVVHPALAPLLGLMPEVA